MKRTLSAAGAVLLVAISGSALACRVAPASQLMDADRQIGQARDVVLAQAIGVAPVEQGDTLIAFAVVTRLAGAAPERFTIVGQVQITDRTDAQADHDDPAFWARGGGRAMSGADCKIHPTFVLGATYLIFRDEPVTRRSYERIAGPADKWLTHVQSGLAQMAPPP